jgi:hypothetical protein
VRPLAVALLVDLVLMREISGFNVETSAGKPALGVIVAADDMLRKSIDESSEPVVGRLGICEYAQRRHLVSVWDSSFATATGGARPNRQASSV